MVVCKKCLYIMPPTSDTVESKNTNNEEKFWTNGKGRVSKVKDVNGLLVEKTRRSSDAGDTLQRCGVDNSCREEENWPDGLSEADSCPGEEDIEEARSGKRWLDGIPPATLGFKVGKEVVTTRDNWIPGKSTSVRHVDGRRFPPLLNRTHDERKELDRVSMAVMNASFALKSSMEEKRAAAALARGESLYFSEKEDEPPCNDNNDVVSEREKMNVSETQQK